MSILQRSYTSLRSRTPRPLRRPLALAAQTFGGWTAQLRILPTFLIVGGQRCGTNSLYEYLTAHPRVGRALAGQEVHFFDLNFARGLDWYRGHFPTRLRAGLSTSTQGSALITGESSPYYMFHPLAPRRIAETIPDAKVLVLLRDPVDRAYSHYQHERARGAETLSLEEAIEREPDRLAGEVERLHGDPGYASYPHQHFSYLCRGRYIDQLEILSSLFPGRNVLVMISEKFFAHPAEGYARTLDFLGLPPYSPRSYGKHNQGRYPELHPGLRRRLADHFTEPNERLSRFLGADPPWD